MSVGTEITDVNERILQAVEAGNSGDLVALLAEGFTIIRASSAKQNRETYLKALAPNAHRNRTADEPGIVCTTIVLLSSFAFPLLNTETWS
jgi:hypothetical protein